MKKASKRIILAITLIMVMVLLPIFGMKLTGAKTKVQVSSVTFTQPTQKSLTLNVGDSYQLKVKVAPSNATNKEVSYKSSDSKIVAVSDLGKLTAKSKGTVKITVTAKDGSGKNAVLTVNSVVPVNTITIINPTDDNLVLTKGKSYNLITTVLPTNANNKSLSYSSANTKVATVDANGKVLAINNGKTVITVKAKDGSGKLDTINIVVGYPVTGISINPTSITKTVGSNYKLNTVITPSNASIKDLRYFSSNTALATVDKAGNIALKAGGTVKISAYATDGSGKQATLTITIVTPVKSITLTETNVTKNVGSSYQVVASVLPTNATNKKLTYTSSDASLATVDANGKVSLLKAGVVKVTAATTDGSALKATVTITIVTPVKSITLNDTSITKNVGSSYQVVASVLPSDATNKKLTYSSSNSSLATVDANGKVSLLKAGVVIITAAATDGSGVKATVTITIVTPVTTITLAETSVTKNVETSYQIVATVLPSDATNKRLLYTSTDTSLATVNSSGMVSLLKAGTVTINVATTDGSGLKATVTITIVTPVETITLADTSVTQDLGTNYQIVATVLPSDATNKKLSYTSTDTSLATVDSNGMVSLLQAGTVTINATATDGSGVTETCTININDPYVGYNLKWEDNFNGTSLNTADWNYELHDPGWVNSELQQYTDSDENTFVKDGSLVIKAIKKVDADGKVSYTSGRVNTMKKQDYKYGRFEARIKSPSGKGFLPAFWMMPTNEDIYGQWPKCGEVDIMEVLGDKPEKAYGTLHFGEPHTQKQGSYTLANSDFASEYHVYACEWEPSEIRFYVDGILYNTVNDWFTKKAGFGEATYPAPFDQSFYMIFNLAVGGSWPGNPDATTQFGENAELKVDYVKVYQKDSYDENVDKPITDVTLRDPDATGNYINNGDFSVNESLSDKINWGFLLAGTGAATAEITNNELVINTTNAGDLDYSVQVVQPDLPMKKGYRYRLTFDASAAEARTMITDVSAPDNGYIRYMPDTITDLTTEKKTYTYEFDMLNNSDPNGRLEFNLGKRGSTAQVKISNVRVEKIGLAVIPPEVKSVLPDGNYVYNGEFQEGINRLAYWNIDNQCDGADVSVTNFNNVRELKTVVPSGVTGLDQVVLEQDPIAISGGKTYILSFDAYGDSNQTIKTTIAGQEFDTTLTSAKTTYKYTVTTDSALTTATLKFLLGVEGTSYIDNVSIKEAGLIINGDFSSGLTGFEPFADSSVSSDVTWSGANNEAVFDIKNPGDAAWKIQLKQNNVKLEEGKWYKITFDAKATIDRDIMYALQPDGNKNGGNWTPYTEQVISLTNNYTTFTKTFQMTSTTDPATILSFSMGDVGENLFDGDGKPIPHLVSFDNIKLEEVGAEMIKNGDFAAADSNWNHDNGSATFADGKATYEIAANAPEEWTAQLKQSGLTLQKGASYDVSFKIKSSVSRTVKFVFLTPAPSYDWYGGEDVISLTAGEEKIFKTTVTIGKDTNSAVDFIISMGKVAPDGELGAHTIEIDDVSVQKK